MPGPEPGRRSSVRGTAPLTRTANEPSASNTRATARTDARGDRAQHGTAIPMQSWPGADRRMLPPSPPPSPPLPEMIEDAPASEDSFPSAPDSLIADSVRQALPLAERGDQALRARHCSPQVDSALHYAAHFEVPATPEMSPANGVHHHPTASAQAFIAKVFPQWDAGLGLEVEDPAVELVCPGWTGAVVSKNAGDNKDRTLYVHMSTTTDRSQLREHMLAILDMASDRVAAGRVVFCLERSLPDLRSLLHGLCYVGGQATAAPGQRDPWIGLCPVTSLLLVTVNL